MMERKCVLIGCGVIANTHTDVLKKLGHKIAAVCDVDAEKAKRHCEKFSLDAKIYSDYREMLDAERPDVAHILTPHYLHAEMVVQVLGRGIFCLCEKPLYIHPDEYNLIENAVKCSNAMLGVCFQHRYIKINQYVRECIQREGFRGAAAFQAWHKDRAYYESGDWRGKYATEGGALLINQAIHCIDQLIWLGGMPESITANLYTRTLGECIEAEDTAELFFDYGGGVVSQLYATNSAASNFSGGINVSTNAGNYEFNAKHLFCNNQEVDVGAEAVDIQARSYWGYGHYNLIRHFYECVETGEPFPVDYREGAKAVKIVMAAYASRGKKIKIHE